MTNVVKKKKEKTIRGETTKAFLLIFAILATVGFFTVYSSMRGVATFKSIRQTHLKQFKAAEVMKQQALDIIGIYYLLGSDQDLDILMDQLKRYDGLIEEFNKASGKLRETLAIGTATADTKKVVEIMDANKQLFAEMNNNCRRMTFSLMENKKDEGKKFFNLVSKDIKNFKDQMDQIESIVSEKLENEADAAQGLLQNSTWIGVGITILAVFVSLGLIYALMRFLSISLLPISNLMHNMRQAVFSIDSKTEVVSPVSRYSNTVFDDDIVGKSIYQILYQEIEPGSQLMAQAKMGLVSTFGEDELQWMMTADCLPSQVNRKLKNPATRVLEDRILKLTYTPLWNKEEKLQNIMIVAEDVTEIEMLRQEAIKKQGEIAVIQGMIDLDKADLNGFLEDSQNKLNEAKSQLPYLSQQAESRQLLFRILHTLKGNSRMYGLNVISEVVHHVENTVVEINQSFADKEPLRDGMLSSLEDGLTKIEGVYANHSRVAKKLFGITDRFGSKKEELFHKSISALEIGIDPIQDPPGDGLDNSQKQLEKSISQALDCADYFNSQELATSLNDFRTKLKGSIVDLRTSLFKVGENYCITAMKSGYGIEYPKDHAKWISMFQKLVEVSESYDKACQGRPDVTFFSNISQDLAWVFNLAEAEGFLFPRLQYGKIISHASLLNSAEHIRSLRPILVSLWRHMVSVFAIDATCNLDQKQAQQLSDIFFQLLSAKDSISTILDNAPPNNLLFVSFLRSLARKQYLPSQFFATSEKFLDLTSAENIVEYFVGSVKDRGALEAFFTATKAVSNEKRPLDKMLDGTNLWALRGLMSDSGFYGSLRFDCVRILAGQFGSVSDEANEEPAVEMSVRLFSEISSKVGALQQGLSTSTASTLVEQVKALQGALKQALDFPVKSVCKKIAPMIKELAHRLDKEIQFKVTGDDIYVEKEQSYQLRDALVHVIRNSLDHGIEPRTERQQLGKSEKAVIEINCKKHNNGMELCIMDDGRGINVDRLTEKAISLGLLTKAEATLLSEEARLQFIFTPNLSTKEEVTDLSGRGVGMDAVKKTVESLGGQVSVSTKAGIGTEFRIFLGEEVGAVFPVKKADTSISKDVAAAIP